MKEAKELSKHSDEELDVLIRQAFDQQENHKRGREEHDGYIATVAALKQEKAARAAGSVTAEETVVEKPVEKKAKAKKSGAKK